MGDKIDVGTRRIFFRGIVDLEAFFRMIRGWIIDQKYEFQERTVKHKMAKEGAIKEMDWFAEKEVTEYLNYQIKVMFKIRDIIGVEVIKKGEKKKLSQCKIILEITPTVVVDPHGIFKGIGFVEKLKNFIFEKVLKKDIFFVYADQLDYRVLKLQGKIKEFLEFEGQELAYSGKA